MSKLIRRWQGLLHKSKPIALPGDLDINGLLSLRVFAHKVVRSGPFRGRIGLNNEDVLVQTSDGGTVECHALPRAIEEVSAAQARKVTVEISSSRHRAISIGWQCDAAGQVVVRGPSSFWIGGARGEIEDFLAQRRYLVGKPVRASLWRRRGPELIIGVVAGLVVTGFVQMVRDVV